MTATPMPESVPETVEDDISLPYGLYFGALNHPHWSTYDHADREARRQAEADRDKVREARVQQLPRLMDHLHYVKIAAGALAAFDKNGQGPAAAENLRIAVERFKIEVDQLTSAIDKDADEWRRNGLAAMEQLEEPKEKRAASEPVGISSIVYTHGPGGEPLPGTVGGGVLYPPRPPGSSAGTIGIVVNATSTPSPAELAEAVRRRTIRVARELGRIT